MKVTLSPRAEKQLEKLPKISQIAIAKKIRTIRESGDIPKEEKLTKYKHKNMFRTRVGDYRIIYKKNKKELYTILIGHRKNIYKRVDRLFQ